MNAGHTTSSIYFFLEALHVKRFRTCVSGISRYGLKAYLKSFSNLLIIGIYPVANAYWHVMSSELKTVRIRQCRCQQHRDESSAQINLQLWLTGLIVQLMPIHFWRMDHGRIVSSMATTKSCERCHSDSEVMDANPLSNSWRNSLIICTCRFCQYMSPNSK